MLIATLAIAGIPPLAGFFSKDAILLGAFKMEGGHPLYAVGLLTALLTSFYMFRLIFLTFHGKARYDEHHVHVHESPWSMLGPLAALAALSVIGGWVAAPALWGGTDFFAKFLAPIFGSGEGAEALSEMAARNLEWTLAGAAIASALIGLALAWWMYLVRPDQPGKLAKSLRPAYKTLLNKYWVDELYAAAVVKPLLWISRQVLWQGVDVGIIDGTVNGIAHGTAGVGDGVRYAQSGNTRSYAVWVVIGAIVILSIIFFWPGSHATMGMVR